MSLFLVVFLFFFQAEDGIRDHCVTGVQTCALPILVVVALSGDGTRAAAVTIEGTVYVWDVATGKKLFDHADGEAGGPPSGSLRFGRDGGLIAPLGDRFGMRRIDVSSKASQIVVSAPKAYGAVAISDDATAFAAVTSSVNGGRSEERRVGKQC